MLTTGVHIHNRHDRIRSLLPAPEKKNESELHIKSGIPQFLYGTVPEKTA
jgi:hypothetical protein